MINMKQFRIIELSYVTNKKEYVIQKRNTYNTILRYISYIVLLASIITTGYQIKTDQLNGLSFISLLLGTGGVLTTFLNPINYVWKDEYKAVSIDTAKEYILKKNPKKSVIYYE
ncbi:MAG: hypothetical protein R3321_10245 [Nitrososphaeraceae archaeon]|nr:hypothetical protein [Nitrososphaeraceae archaeon]